MNLTLRVWQARHGFTYNTAAAALGVNRATYARYLKRKTLPRWLVLACMAIDSGLDKEMGDELQRSADCAE